MNKNLKYFLLQNVIMYSCVCANATEKFDILPDLPELAMSAQASSVTSIEQPATTTKSVGHTEPNFITVLGSLIFVILLIYFVGILYSKMNNLKLATFSSSNSKKSINPIVLSSTSLGANKTLHVVELEGQRMLIGASNSSIHLLKDLENTQEYAVEDAEYSKIEIPSIRIPKIEIPKIEIPGFTKIIKTNKNKDYIKEEINDNSTQKFVFTEIYEENSDEENNNNQPNFKTDDDSNIIETLFKTNHNAYEENFNENIDNNREINHTVDPDEFALYKKYIN